MSLFWKVLQNEEFLGHGLLLYSVRITGPFTALSVDVYSTKQLLRIFKR